MEFHRRPLTPAIEQTLAQLQLPLSLWRLPAVSGDGTVAETACAAPPMNGGGKRAQPSAEEGSRPSASSGPKRYCASSRVCAAASSFAAKLLPGSPPAAELEHPLQEAADAVQPFPKARVRAKSSGCGRAPEALGKPTSGGSAAARAAATPTSGRAPKCFKRPRTSKSSKRDLANSTSLQALCEPIVFDGEITVSHVQDAINNAFRSHECVHGEPPRVLATVVKRKHIQAAFQLRCENCRRGTCSWRATAKYESQGGTLRVIRAGNGAHGQPKGPANKRTGRRRGPNARSLTDVHTLQYHGEVSRDKVRDFIVQYFRKQPAGQSLHVAASFKGNLKAGMTFGLACKTHWDPVDKSLCTWAGSARLDLKDRETKPTGPFPLTLRSQPCDAHKPHERRIYGTLTHRLRCLVQNSEDKSTAAIERALRGMKTLHDPTQVASLPKSDQLQSFMSRHRRKCRASSAEDPPSNAKTFQPADFEFLRDRCNAGLKGGRSLASTSPQLRADDQNLRVVDMSLAAASVCAPLVCPALLHSVLSLTPKPWNFKFSADGKHRLLFQNYVLLTLGINVKNWSKRKDAKMFAFRSSFLPLAFAIADKENEQAYTSLARSVFHVAQTLGHDLQPAHALQWHGGQHKGIEAARQQVCPSARRVSDWAHVMGATSKGPAGVPGLARQTPITSQLSKFVAASIAMVQAVQNTATRAIPRSVVCALSAAGRSW